MKIPENKFGNKRVTLVGLGGEGVLRTHGRETEAEKVVTEALGQTSPISTAPVSTPTASCTTAGSGGATRKSAPPFSRPANPPAATAQAR